MARNNQPEPPQLLPTMTGGVETVAKFFRALGDPTRLRLLEFLLHDEHTVTECVDRVGLSQGRVSTHLACLADCGYVEQRRDGRYSHYRVTDPRVADLVVLARALAADNTASLAACMRIDNRDTAAGATADTPDVEHAPRQTRRQTDDPEPRTERTRRQ